jgi:hypothetical protein
MKTCGVGLLAWLLPYRQGPITAFLNFFPAAFSTT